MVVAMMLVRAVVPVMMMMRLVDQAELLEQGMGGHCRPDGQQKHHLAMIDPPRLTIPHIRRAVSGT